MQNVKYPMRERKKAESRAKLIASAQELFAAKGYENTTLEEVAEAAGLHVQTLYRHFANKQELATAGLDMWIERFKSAIMAADRNMDTFAFWRWWLKRSTEFMADHHFEAIRRHTTMLRSQPMMGSSWALHLEYEDLLTQSFAKDFGMSAEGVGLPRLVAGMLASANAYVLFEFAKNGGDLEAEALKAVDMVEAQFGHLVGGSSDQITAAE